MNCFSELTYSMYVDGELPAEELREVEAHLTSCPRCRALAEALRAENRVLLEVFHEPAAGGAAINRQRVGLSMLWMSLFALGVAVSLDRAFVELEKAVPRAAEWLNPFSASWLQTFFFNTTLYLIKEGPTMLHTLITTLSLLMVALLIIGAVRFLMRRRHISIALLAGLALAFGVTPRASAVQRRGGATVTIPAGETLDETLLAHSDTVDVAGNLNGNLFAGAHRTIIKGDVKGDLVVGAQTVDIQGTVEGNVFGWAQTLRVSGHVTGSVVTWAQTLEVERGGRVDVDVIAGSGATQLRGTVGRDVESFTGVLEAEGSIGRNLDAYAGTVQLNAPARVGGDLTAYVHKHEDVQIDSGATIAGKTEIKIRGKKASEYTQPKFYFWQAVWLAAALLIGLLIYWLYPALFGARLETASAVMKEAGIGFLILVATPIAVIIAAITLIGLPVALIGLAAWIAGLYLAKVFVAAWVGRSMTQSTAHARPFALALLVGLFIVFVAINLPYLGGWINALILLPGLAMPFRQWWRTRQEGVIARPMASASGPST